MSLRPRSESSRFLEGWPVYVPVAERHRRAAKHIAALKKAGQKIEPVLIQGRSISTTFWGNAWCRNLESYSDFSSRLPRGRTYVRNGSVIHLGIERGTIRALVQGSSLYTVTITISPVRAALWEQIVTQCAGQINSVVELLQGKLSAGVMGLITQQKSGLFPAPNEIEMSCTCPDWATMCKHVAAALYGVGARLDTAPDLLFLLRGADPMDLVKTAAKGGLGGRAPLAKEKVLHGDLSNMFGIELEGDAGESAPAPARPTAPRRAVVAPKVARDAKKKVRGRPKEESSISRATLLSMGVPSSTIGSWVNSGVLLRSGKRGVYEATPRTQERLLFFAKMNG